jgi:hypothetical protein
VTAHTFTDTELKAHNAAIRSAALAEAVKVLDAYSEYDRSLCCDGRECGCHGSSVFDVIKHYTLALATTPPGMVCVPVEPTKEMCEAAEALPAIDGVNDLPLAKAGWSPRAIQNLKRYRAMLAAHGGKE